MILELTNTEENRNKVRSYMKNDVKFKPRYEELKKKQQQGKGIKKLTKQQRKEIILGEINAGHTLMKKLL